jgi:predicted PurR-regulated permease PerM
MKKDKINYKILNLLMIVAIVCLLYWINGLWLGIFEKVVAVILPFALAFVIAYALYPFVKKLINCGFPKWLAVGCVIFILVGFLSLILVMVVPMLYDQIVLFLSNISAFITDISSKYELDLGVLQSSFSTVSTDVIKTLSKYLSDGAVSIVNTSISVISILIVTAIVSVYILCDMDKIRAFVKNRLKRCKNRSYDYVKKLDNGISGYFTGLGLNILIQLFEYTIVFKLIGHPNYLILGVLAAVTTIIPYFGGLIVNILACLIASVVSVKLFVLTLIVCLVCPNIDGYIVSPRVYGKTNKLHPLVNIFAVFAGGILGGFWGIVVSLPVAIIILITFNFFKEDISDKIEEIKEKK